MCVFIDDDRLGEKKLHERFDYLQHLSENMSLSGDNNW